MYCSVWTYSIRVNLNIRFNFYYVINKGLKIILWYIMVLINNIMNFKPTIKRINLYKGAKENKDWGTWLTNRVLKTTEARLWACLTWWKIDLDYFDSIYLLSRQTFGRIFYRRPINMNKEDIFLFILRVKNVRK